MSSIAPLPAADGRTARADRTRLAVVDAMLALIEDGDPQPTAPRIAERAGVSLRSVFQHFADLETLYATAADRQVERVLALSRPIPPDGALDARIDTLVRERARLHEAITHVRRFATRLEPFSPVIAARLAWVRQRGRTEIARVFARELARLAATERRDLLEALTAAASWSAWEALRAHQGLSVTRARSAMLVTIRSLLHGAPASGRRGSQRRTNGRAPHATRQKGR